MDVRVAITATNDRTFRQPATGRIVTGRLAATIDYLAPERMPLEPSKSVKIPLFSCRTLRWGTERRHEPITVGVPLPAGAVRSDTEICLIVDGAAAPVQVRPLDHWPDQSIRWALVSFAAGARAGTPAPARTARS
jgi:hypothetical protein